MKECALGYSPAHERYSKYDKLNIAFLVSFALLLFFVQLADFTIPFTSFEIGGLLSTKVLSMNDWGIIISVAVLVVVIEEFRKFIVNSKIFAINSRP